MTLDASHGGDDCRVVYMTYVNPRSLRARHAEDLAAKSWAVTAPADAGVLYVHSPAAAGSLIVDRVAA